MIDVTFRQLEYFVAVCDAGTTSAAAQRLHVSQSAVSLSLKQLERSLAVTLLDRHARNGMRPTATGRLVLAEARELLRSADRLASVAAAHERGEIGQFLLGCHSSLSRWLLPAVRDEAERLAM